MTKVNEDVRPAYAIFEAICNNPLTLFEGMSVVLDTIYEQVGEAPSDVNTPENGILIIHSFTPTQLKGRSRISKLSEDNPESRGVLSEQLLLLYIERRTSWLLND